MSEVFHHSFLHHMLSTCCELTFSGVVYQANKRDTVSVPKNSPLSEGSKLENNNNMPVAKETKKKKKEKGMSEVCGESHLSGGPIRWLEDRHDTFQGKQNSLAGRSAWGSKTSWERAWESKETPNKWRWGFGRSLLCRICWVLQRSLPDSGFCKCCMHL